MSPRTLASAAKTLILLAMVSVVQATWAEGVSINVGNRGSNFSSGLQPAEVAGALPLANWNDLTIPFTLDVPTLLTLPSADPGELKDSNGVIVPPMAVNFFGFSISPPPSNIGINDTYNYGPNGDPVQTANMKLMGSFLKGPDSATLGLGFEVTGIPYAEYDLYIYLDGFGTAVTLWDINGSEYYSVDASPANFIVSNFQFSGYVASDMATANAERANPTANHNYMKISGLTSPTLLAQGFRPGGGEEAISGIQIVNAAAQPGDYDVDGDVDGNDFLVWQKTLGSTTELAADGDNSLEVDGPDLDIWEANFGEPNATVAASAIPEPSALVLAALSTLLMSGRRALRRRWA